MPESQLNLPEILASHARWLAGDPSGQRANLDGANLNWANLNGANLDGASLDGASLDGARNWPSATPLPTGYQIAACKCCVERVS